MGDERLGRQGGGAEEGNPTSTRVLDPALLAQYEAMSPGLSAELISLFERDVPLRLEVLRTAVVAEDWTAVAEVAHTLKGSSGNLGATALAEACGTLNASAAIADVARIAELTEEVEDEWSRVQAVLATGWHGGPQQ